jgi:hypothetical protein
LLAALLLKTKDEEANWYNAATFDVVLVGLLLTPPAVALLYNSALLCLSHVAEWLHARRESNAKRRESIAKQQTSGNAEPSPTTTADQIANRAIGRRTNKHMKTLI